MTKYRFVIHARKCGAIGIRSTHVTTVEADNEADARLKLYEKYEHISVARVEYA